MPHIYPTAISDTKRGLLPDTTVVLRVFIIETGQLSPKHMSIAASSILISKVSKQKIDICKACMIVPHVACVTVYEIKL